MEPTNFTKPHDRFFRKYFGRKDHIVPLLEFILPLLVSALLDLSNLEIDSGTYIDREHKQHFSDISLTVPLKNTEKGEALKVKVYILIEHKSYRSPDALLQLLRYMVQI